MGSNSSEVTGAQPLKGIILCVCFINCFQISIPAQRNKTSKACMLGLCLSSNCSARSTYRSGQRVELVLLYFSCHLLSVTHTNHNKLN